MMLKLFNTLMITTLFTSAASAQNWYEDSTYQRAGRVYQTQQTQFTKSKTDEGDAKHTPTNLNEVSRATVEYVGKKALLHFKYSEAYTGGKDTMSYRVTPKNTDPNNISQEVYASIVLKKGLKGKMEVFVFSENYSDSKPDYASTIASALKVIFYENLSARCRLGAQDIETVTIVDNTDLIGKKLAKKLQKDTLHGLGLTKYSPAFGNNPEWSMAFTVMK